MNLTDAHSELLSGLNSREDKAFDELFRMYYPALSLFAAGILNDMEAARDVVQDVMINTWEQDYRFKEMPALRSFLYTGVRNKALNLLEKDNNRRRIRESLPEEPAPGYDNFLMEVESMVLVRISAAIEELPPQSREVFQLSFVDPHDIA